MPGKKFQGSHLAINSTINSYVNPNGSRKERFTKFQTRYETIRMFSFLLQQNYLVTDIVRLQK